jgi:large-conductance mechanosensitive channel
VKRAKEKDMDIGYLLGFLALFTIIAVIVFALISKKKTDDRLKDPAAHRDENKSRLAKDAPDR